MGKETKIGLAVIGVLLLIFGVLLFRHFSAGEPAGLWDDETRAAVQPLAAESSTDKPNLVTAQKDRPGRATGDSAWDTSPGQESSGPDVEVPAASYMPAATGPAPAAVPDRYSIGRQSIDEPPRGENQPASASPFQNREPRDQDTAGDAEPVADEALNSSAEGPPDEAASSEPRGNPLRRLSADVPLNPPGEASSPETGAELPDQGHDRYSIDAEPARPADAPHAAQPPSAAEGAPGVDRTGPEVPGGPQGIDRAPAPVQADDAPQPAQDDFRQDPDNHRGQPSQNDWSTSGAADDPVAGRNAPLPVEDGMYTVQPNDTLWSISEKVYGTGGYFKAIAAHNRANLPRSDQLSVGMKIAVPAVGELEQDYRSLCPKQRKSALVKPRAMPATANVPDGSASDVYVVEDGDTLFDIARYELGKASRWAEIYELNREKLGQDFDYLQPGTELRLPAKTRATEAVSRDRDTRYLR